MNAGHLLTGLTFVVKSGRSNGRAIMLTDYPLIARHLTFKAGFKKIITDVTLVLKKNEFAGLIGGSGSGKTTLLTCLNGFREPSSGEVILNGISRKEFCGHRRLVGFVPQEDLVHPTLTVKKALYYACLLRLDEHTPADKTDYLVNKILYQLDLRVHQNKRIRSLSGGQRKRVSIGVELLHSPPLFFLDEPTAGLDPRLERRLMELLRSLSGQERSILLTTHLMQNVHLFDILIFIHGGHLIYFGPSSEITSYFRASDMIDLFDRVIPADPSELGHRFAASSLRQDFLSPRIKASANV